MRIQNKWKKASCFEKIHVHLSYWHMWTHLVNDFRQCNLQHMESEQAWAEHGSAPRGTLHHAIVKILQLMLYIYTDIRTPLLNGFKEEFLFHPKVPEVSIQDYQAMSWQTHTCARECTLGAGHAPSLCLFIQNTNIRVKRYKIPYISTVI